MVRVRGLPAGTALFQPQVLVTGIIAVVSFCSAVKIGRAGKAIQVVMAFSVTLLSAATMDSRELSSLVYFGLLIALAYAYGFLQRKLWLKLIGFTVPVLITTAIRLWNLHPGVTAVVAQWFAGAVFVLSLYAAVITAVHTWFRSKEMELQGRVQRRTADLQSALDRNRILLQEVQHRTKNNLQLIASLLSLQQSDPDIESRAVSDVLETTRRRIQAMSTAHELLYSSGTTSTISLTRFVLELTDEFVRSDRLSDIHVDTPLDSDVRVEMDYAGPLGLIITELVANSAEHAVVPDGEHIVWVKLSLERSGVSLTIEDRGTRFPEDISIDHPTTTGLQIVAALVSQIRGEISLERTPNTKWIVQAPLPTRTEEEVGPHASEQQ